MSRKIIITGAGGLVGLNLISVMKQHHDNIIAIDKNEKRIKLIQRIFPIVQAHCIDLATAKNKWEHLFVKSETIIMLHAQINDLDSRPYYDNNVYSVQKVMDVAKAYNFKHVIFTSSSVVISVSDDLYVRTKAEGERIVVNGNIPFTVVRPPLMYKCFDYKHLGFLTNLMEKLKILPFPGSGKYIRQPLYVMDLCNIIISTMKSGPTNKVHNLIGKEEIYFIDLLKIIKKKRKINSILVPLPLNLFAFLVWLWGKIIRKAPFVKDQIIALTAGDVFPLSDWESEFNVKYTPFDNAFDEILKSEYKDFRSGHEE